jgi:hypothetical protein
MSNHCASSPQKEAGSAEMRGLLQSFFKKLRHGGDRSDPVSPEQGIVDIIRQDEFFDVNSPSLRGGSSNLWTVEIPRCGHHRRE